MPISPIVLQRRHAELGRIRLGAKTTYSNGKEGPRKLDAFRFTSASERYIRDLAALYGGEARQWDNNGKPEWEVYTEAKTIPVIAVKGGLSQWMETWSGGGLVHRCDGERQADGSLCDPDDKAHQQAKPTTRLSMMLPELEAVGVFRMESHGWNAAAEIPAVAELALYVGDLVPAQLHLVERRTVKDGQTSRFVVPVLDLQIGVARLREIVAEKSGATPAVEAQPERKALEPGKPDGDDEAAGYMQAVADATDAEQLMAVYEQAKKAGVLGGKVPKTHPLYVAIGERHRALTADGEADGPAEAEADPDKLWEQILSLAGQQGWTRSDLEKDFAANNGGVVASAASAAELEHYLRLLQGQEGAA